MAENKQPQIEWNDKDMRTTYVNATNVVAGREEVMMILGVNRAWQMNQEKVDVAISDRIVMNPYTAKRLAIMLSATVRAYEKKYGPLDIGVNTAPAASAVGHGLPGSASRQLCSGVGFPPTVCEPRQLESAATAAAWSRSRRSAGGERRRSWGGTCVQR